MDILHLMPREIVDLIKQFIPLRYRLLLSKTYYLKYHSIVRSLILPSNFERYIRTTIDRDHEFVFGIVLRENYERWLQMKDYMHRDYMYSNYLYFVKSFCLDCDSFKCYEVINSFLKELGLGKNLHKKNISRSIIYHH
jgi:hypothetical protein